MSKLSAAALNKLALRHLKPAPFSVGPRPIMIFGMGTHTYPNARASVGYFLVEMLGKRLGSGFHRYFDCNAYLAHYAPENLLLVQPDTYFVSDNHQCMRRVIARYPVDPRKSVLVYHEPSLPLGTVEYMTQGRTDGNKELSVLAKEFKSEEFPRIAVGIDYPKPNYRFEPPPIHSLQTKRGDYSEFFLLNKFPHSHWVQLHEEVVPKVFAAIDKAVGHIREEFPLSNVEEWDPIRPELAFEKEQPYSQRKGEDESEGEAYYDEEPIVFVGPRVDPNIVKHSKRQQNIRLEEVRKARERNPEFGRLLSTGARLSKGLKHVTENYRDN